MSESESSIKTGIDRIKIHNIGNLYDMEIYLFIYLKFKLYMRSRHICGTHKTRYEGMNIKLSLMKKTQALSLLCYI